MSEDGAGRQCFRRQRNMTKQQVISEFLEPRRLLDASATLDSRGVFRVTGTDNGETIDIVMSSDGTKVQAKLNDSLLGEAAVGDVRAILVSALAGNDTVTIDAAITKRTAVRGGD